MAESTRRSARLLLALLSLLSLLLGACTRKAPGPHECYRFALEVVGVKNPRMLRSPDVKSAVDQLTNRCLTTPFDRQLLACVNQLGEVSRCFQAFQARRSRPQLPPADNRM